MMSTAAAKAAAVFLSVGRGHAPADQVGSSPRSNRSTTFPLVIARSQAPGNPLDYAGAELVHPSIRGIAMPGCTLLAMTFLYVRFVTQRVIFSSI